jgi:uncharacterized OB-fold protein
MMGDQHKRCDKCGRPIQPWRKGCVVHGEKPVRLKVTTASPRKVIAAVQAREKRSDAKLGLR